MAPGMTCAVLVDSSCMLAAGAAAAACHGTAVLEYGRVRKTAAANQHGLAWRNRLDF